MERFLIVGLIHNSKEKEEKLSSLLELKELVRTYGGEVVDMIIQVRNKEDPAYHIGEGKVKEIACWEGFDTIIFDEPLKAAQIRNIEEITKRRVIDRRDIILDIFAKHARTNTAKIEVELARLKFLLPRLTGKGNELSRTGGGIGTRGPGEQKLEKDRRRIKERINYLEEKLKDIEKTLDIQRKRRSDLFTVALLGYTNVGKSTLLNALTKSKSYVDDKLFATLDPLTRIGYTNNGKKYLLTDTVGFIKNIPHQLIASFKSTLKEASFVDLRLLVIDLSDERYEMQIEESMNIMKMLGIDDKEFIYVFNKIDRVVDSLPLNYLKEKYSNSIFVSALRGDGLKELKDMIEEMILRKEARYYNKISVRD
uniref:GTPase HflX n=1 Tax=candidate division WOR-3 bacterium TaxID=2052148 RepID=A0A7C4U787_UNCW3